MRNAAKTDSNQVEVVKALRQIGVSVQCLHQIGKGCPDLLWGYRGYAGVLEVKDGALPPSARQLTEDEKDWRAKWAGPYAVVGTPEEAQLAVIEEVTRRDEA